MKLPGTIKGLREALTEFPGVSRVTVPTKFGPFVLEFSAPLPPTPRAPAERRPEPPDEGTVERPKVRDTRMLERQPPEWRWEDPS